MKRTTLGKKLIFYKVLSIGINANIHKYNHRGERHGPDILKEYEPADAEYKYEKEWQEDGDPISVDVDVKVTTEE